MPVCYIIEGPTCAGKTTLAKECVKHGRLLVPSYLFHVSNVGSTTPPVENLHYFGEHTPARVEGETTLDRQFRIFDEFKRLQGETVERVRGGESIVMDFSTMGVHPFSGALMKTGRMPMSWPETSEPHNLLWKAFNEFLVFVGALRKAGAEVFLTMLCPPATLIAERLAYRNRPGDDAWDPLFIEHLASEYQAYACNVMIKLNLGAGL